MLGEEVGPKARKESKEEAMEKKYEGEGERKSQVGRLENGCLSLSSVHYDEQKKSVLFWILITCEVCLLPGTLI